MRQLLTLLFLLLTTVSLVYAQGIEVPRTQGVLIMKRTADWCPNCGTWGWTFFRDLLEEHDDDAVLMAVHHSGDLMNDLTRDLMANFQSVSQPRFLVDGVDQFVTSTNAPNKKIVINNLVEAAKSVDPLAQTGLLVAEIDDEELDIRTRTQFFTATEGTYYLGVYVVEKTVIASQANQGPMAEHKQLLRAGLGSNWYGVPLDSGTIAANSTYDIPFRLTLGDHYDDDNLELVSIIWRANGDKFDLINVNSVDDFEDGPLSVTDLGQRGYQLTVAPNPVRATLNLELVLPETLSNSRLELVDAQGRTVQLLRQTDWLAGVHREAFPLTGSLPAGTYWLRLLGADGQLVRAVVIER